MNLRGWTMTRDRAPERHMSGCIEGIYQDPRGMHAIGVLHYYNLADGRSLWGAVFDSPEGGGVRKTHYPQFDRWRFTGPLVPDRLAQGQSIIVWPFRAAPGELRSLSDHGGDEDWVALLPPKSSPPTWMDSGTSFGVCSVSEHPYEDGRIVVIGAHS